MESITAENFDAKFLELLASDNPDPEFLQAICAFAESNVDKLGPINWAEVLGFLMSNQRDA